MVQGDHWSDPSLQKGIDELVIVLRSQRIDLSFASGKDPRPRDGEAIKLHIQIQNQLEIFFAFEIAKIREVSRSI
jgi:hypothetical protein